MRRVVSLSGGALGVQRQDLLGYLLYVGDAAEGDLYLRGHVVAAGDGVGEDDDVAGAVGALAMLDAEDVGRSVRLYGTAGAAGDYHERRVGAGANGARSL